MFFMEPKTPENRENGPELCTHTRPPKAAPNDNDH
jgi:hypothetical protein